MSEQLCPACAGRSDDGLICNGCTSALRKNIRAIPALMRELDTTLTRQSQTGTGNGGKNSTRPLPFDAHASELADEVKNFLVAWVRTFELGDWPEDGIASICGWFLARDQRIRGHEEGAFFVDEVADVVRRIRRAIDLRPEMVYLGVCGNLIDVFHEESGDITPELCNHQMYARKRDEAHDCPGEPGVHCGAIYNVKDRQEYLRELARDQSATIGTCAQVLALFGMPVKAGTIDSWTRPRTRTDHNGDVHVMHPPRLWRTGVNEGGANVYRVGDIEDIVKETMARKSARQTA